MIARASKPILHGGLVLGALLGFLAKALLVLSVMEVVFTSYMAYLQVAVIRAVCSWCMLSAGLTVVLAVLVISAVFGKAAATRASLA